MESKRRLNTSLSVDLVDSLNKQIKMEAHSSAQYLAMAAWCESKGYDNSADFFFNQSDEERIHMLKIFKYLCDLGGEAKSPTIDEVQHEYANLREVFEKALEAEINVTIAINNIVGKAREEKNYQTENFIQWFVQEQIEEEYIARRAVELFELMGEDKMALFMIDERIPKIAFSAAEKQV